jgi:hypothetical protein
MLHMEEISNSSVRNICVGLITCYLKEHFRDLSQGIEAMDCMKGGHAQLYGIVAQFGLNPATVWRVESSPLGIRSCAGERGIIGILEWDWDEFCDVVSTPCPRDERFC